MENNYIFMVITMVFNIRINPKETKISSSMYLIYLIY